MTTAKKKLGGVLAALGVLTLVVELLRHWFTGTPIYAWSVVIGSLFGFVGFYALDPMGAKDAGGFVEGFTVRVLGVIRAGRRSTDVKIVADAKPSADPEAPKDE